MIDKKPAGAVPAAILPFPELSGRVAVLSGSHTETSLLLVGLALRHCQQSGSVLCLDASHHQQTEVQFRLLLRQRTVYQRLAASSAVPPALAHTALRIVSQGLANPHSSPPLLLLDNLVETPDWERMVQFLLNAGATLVEILPEARALRFGRYDTVILLRAAAEQAEAASRAVGRKVTSEEIIALKPGEAFLVSLAQVYRVAVPRVFTDKKQET